MKAWYSKVRDTKLKDGSVRATYVATFETDNSELKRKVEKYLQSIMDEAEQTEPHIVGKHADVIIIDEPQTEYDKYRKKIRPHDPHKDWYEDEPQMDIHDLTDCDFCKDRNCKDCEGGKDEPQKEAADDLQLFADILFDKNKTAQFLKECKAMGIEP